jgi:hypothetical protein
MITSRRNRQSQRQFIVSISKRLLHPAADWMIVVLCFDDGDGKIRSEVQNEVSPFRLAALDGLPVDNDLPGGEGDFFAHLRLQVPPGPGNRRRDGFYANVSFAERLLIERHRFRSHRANLSPAPNQP